MNTISLRASAARRIALATAVAGIAAFGAIATAPIASAAPAAASENGNGPDMFLDLDHGRMPVFFCDEDNPNQRQHICIELDGPRF